MFTMAEAMLFMKTRAEDSAARVPRWPLHVEARCAPRCQPEHELRCVSPGTSFALPASHEPERQPQYQPRVGILVILPAPQDSPHEAGFFLTKSLTSVLN